MKLRLRVQTHLVVAWEADTNGDWVFTLCRRGLQKILNRKLRPGEELLIEVEGSVLSDMSDQ